VQELQAEARERGLAIEGVALSEGPGSYTGLRIAASLAKGLCYGLDVPLYAVSTLAVIAYSASENIRTRIFTEEHGEIFVCPMIDARRMEVYCAVYRVSGLGDEGISGLVEAKVIDEHSFEELLDQHAVYFCGNGAEKCKAVIKHENARWIDGIVPTGAAAGKLVEVSIQNSEVRNQISEIRNQISEIRGKEIAYFEPNYLKEFIAAPSHVKGLH
jgi:tRNA threonylcarbamoyladenosine biosynthesis protein TsaB